MNSTLPIQKTAIETTITSISINTYFQSDIRKIKAHGNSIYALQFYKVSANDQVKSQIIKVTNNNVQYVTLPDKENWVDFDIDQNEQLIGLVSKEENIIEPSVEIPLKSLYIQIGTSTTSRFIFKDSRRNQAIIYSSTGSISKAQHYSNEQDLFLTSSPTIQFAKIATYNNSIYLSITGTIGFKVFQFNYSGAEIWQQEIVPQSEYNTSVADRAAPLISITDKYIFTATVITNSEQSIFERHFNVKPNWPSGAKYGTIIQIFRNSERRIHILRDKEDLKPTAIESQKFNDKIIFGIASELGTTGNHKAYFQIFSKKFKSYFHKSFSLKDETYAYAIALRSNSIYIGGQLGSMQVSTGSVTSFGDAFVQEYNFQGKLIKQKIFGTDRDDLIKSIALAKDKIYLGGIADAPITHTADEDSSLGYSKSIFGSINL